MRAQIYSIFSEVSKLELQKHPIKSNMTLNTDNFEITYIQSNQKTIMSFNRELSKRLLLVILENKVQLHSRYLDFQFQSRLV